MADDDKIDIFTNLNPEDLAPELQTIYKNMQADYTRKTQEIAGRRKEFDTKETNFEARLVELGELKARDKQWTDWYQTLEEQVEQDKTDKGANVDTTNVDLTGLDDDKLAKMFGNLQTTIKDLESKIESTNLAIRQSGDQTSRMFNYQAQLNDLTREHTDLDREKLLNHAIQTGQTDLTKAYHDLYADDLFNKRVDAGVAEALAKRKTDGISTTGHQMIVRSKDKAPKTWDEATEQIVLRKATEGTLD